MSFAKKISKAIVWNHLNKCVGYFLDFCLTVVLTRGFGAYFYGIYSELFNIIFLFSLFCSLGVDTAVNVYIPRYRENPAILAQLIRSGLKAIAISSLLIFIATIGFKETISAIIKSPDVASYLVVAAFYIVVYNFVVVAQAILTSFYETRVLFLTNISLKSGFVLSAIVTLSLGYGLNTILISFCILSFAVSVFYLFLIKHYLVSTQGDRKLEAVSFFKFSMRVWLTRFLNYFLGRYFDIFLLGYFAIRKEEIGFYNLAFSLTLALSYAVTSGFSGVSLAAFSDMSRKGNLKGIAKGWIAISKIIILFCVPIFAFTIVNAKQLIVFLYSLDFVDSAPLFQVFACFFLISLLLGSGNNLAVLYSLKREKMVLYLRGIMGILNVLLNLILIPRYNAMGAIVATGSSIVLIIAVEFVLLNKYLPITYPFRFLFIVLFATFIPIAGSALISNGSIVLNVLILLLAFNIIIFVMKPFESDDLNIFPQGNDSFNRLLIHFTKT